MLENKKFNVILSLILAIGLWVYVVGEVNPTAEETIKDIPVTFTNTDVLASRGLAVSSSSAETIELVVKGSRSDLARLKNTDIKASLDMSEAAKGENEISVDVRVPDGIEVMKKSMSKIVVTVENLKERTVKIHVSYSGKLKENEEATTIKLSQETAKISGAETLVNSVEYLQGKIDASKIGEEETVNKCSLKPVDNKNNYVPRLSVEPSEISVTSIISQIKTVDLKVPIVNNSTDDAERKMEVPDKVIIAGRADTLREITSLTAEPVDISNQDNGEEIPIHITLPEGIKLSDKNKGMYVKVVIQSLGEKTFEFSSDEIKLEGEHEDLSYSFESGMKVTVLVKGKKENLKNIDKGSITVTCDVSQLDESSTRAQLSVSVKGENVSASISPETAHIIIEKANNN